MNENMIDELLVNCEEMSKDNNGDLVKVYCSWFWLDEVKNKIEGKSEIIESVELDDALDEDTMLYIKLSNKEVK